MPMSIALLVCALLLAAFSSLTAVRVPVVVNWRLALLAGEYGHFLVVLPVATAVAAWWLRGAQTGWAMVTVGVCALATGLFLKPVWQAKDVARDLPGRLAAQFGGTGPERSPLVWGRLHGWSDGTATGGRVETRRFAPGMDLDFYRPPAVPEGGVPCVVVIHGGGWDSGDRSQLSDFNHWLVERGHAVAAISYRLAPEHPWPAQRDDALAAIAYLKAHADELGIDARRLVLFGRSAGGQIATAVGYTAKDPDIRGVVSFYAPYDMRFVWSISRDDDALNSLKLMRQYLGGPPEPGRESLYDSASPQLHVRRGETPPTLLVHGVIDTLVWQRHSERLAARLAEEGVPHVNLALPWAVHALEFNRLGPSGQLTTYALEWFLAEVTGRPGDRR